MTFNFGGIFGSKKRVISDSQRKTAIDVAMLVGGGMAAAVCLVYAPAVFIIGLLLAALAYIAFNQEKFFGEQKATNTFGFL